MFKIFPLVKSVIALLSCMLSYAICVGGIACPPPKLTSEKGKKKSVSKSIVDMSTYNNNNDNNYTHTYTHIPIYAHTYTHAQSRTNTTSITNIYNIYSVYVPL